MKHALTKTTWVLLAVFILGMMPAAVPAQAAEFPVSAVLTLNPDAIPGPQKVTAQVQVTNISGADMTSPVSLYDPYGKLVSVFGRGGEAVLKKDASTSVSAEVLVSQAMMDAGEVSYTLRWQSPDGQELALPVVCPVSFSGEKGNLRIVRAISPEVVRSGQTVKITYELTNVGDSTIQSVTVQEKLQKNPKTIKSLAAGDTKKVEFSVKMGSSDLTSGASVKFRVASGSPEEVAVVEDTTIPLAVKNLSATVSVDRSAVNIGETVMLTLAIVNGGNITYSDVTATEKTLGTLFEGLEIPAGATIYQNKELQVNGPTTYQIKLNLNDNTGMTNTYDTNSVSVSAFDPEKELKLTMLLTADKESLVHPPEDVAMTLVVTNTSNVDCKKVAITHAGVAIGTIDVLAAGQSVTLKRDFTVSQAGQFRFTATTKDTVGNTAVFESNTLTLMTARQTPAPTPVPTPTIAPLVTIEPVTYENVSQPLRIMRNVLYPVANVLGVLSAAALLLFLVSTFIRFKKRHDSDTAYDHLDLAEKRDYSQPAEENEPSESSEEETPPAREEMQEEPADQADQPQETPEESAEEQPAQEPQAEETDAPMGHSGGFRMTRDSQTDEFPPYSQDDVRKPDYKPARRSQRTDLAEEAADELTDAAADARDEVTGAWKKTREAKDDLQAAVENAEETVQQAAEDLNGAIDGTAQDNGSERNALPDRRRRRNRRS